MADGRIYMLQPSFASGEISPDVASRVDLDKYQSALLQAENVFVRPYGSAYRRPGTEMVDTILGGYTRLKEFAVDADTSYLLVFREANIYVYKDGELQATVSTPFGGSELYRLRFAQSADVMFIASGNHPVQVLTRYSDTSWTLADFVPEPGYFDATTMKDGVTITPSAKTGTVTLTASSGVFSAGQVGNVIELEQERDSETVSLAASASSASGSTDSMTAYVTGWRLVTTGSWEGTVKVQKYSGGWVDVATYTSTGPGYNVDDTAPLDSTTMIQATVSLASGSVTVNLTRQAWTDDTDPLDPITHDAETKSVSCTVNRSASILAGAEGWKVISHGTWTGEFSIEYSKDNVTWKKLRTYSSKNDFNVTESGTFDEPTYIRLDANITSGSANIDLTRFPYTHKGTAKITAYTDATHVTAGVIDDFADTSAAEGWAFGAWSAEYGYPSCVTFFQDRLCFASNARQPYMVWMSRTGDYYNFGTEKIDGTLTDDSAVAVSFISRKDYRILHLVAHADLLVMTEGNEWIINGAEVVTPTNVSPRVQTSRGSTDVVPEMIGGQMIYVQRHGRTVRDLQYNFGTDSYDGMDLTILAKHITQDKTIVDSAYRQEPDYMVFFVLNDGTAACLTYVSEQRVYAWSRIVTDGHIKSVESVATPYYDDVYFIVERGGINYLERLSDYPHDDFPHSYVLMDCAKTGINDTPSDTITAAWLANKEVIVLADGCAIKGLTADSTGTVTLDVPCTCYTIGIPYMSIWELPNIEMQLNDGTLQGRRKKVAEVILRLENSLGGRVGINTNKTDIIKYDELLEQEVYLYSGEKIVTVPNVAVGGFNDRGRIVVTSDDPYPLSIASIVRAVVPGG